jgi:ABC-type phosphate/phosphonate transport system substrate-binding protein
MKVRVTIGFVLASTVALAAPRDFVVEHAGFGATTEQAKPFLEKFVGYVQSSQKWPDLPKSEFFPEPDAAFKKAIGEAGFAMIDPDQVLDLWKKDGVRPIVTVEGKNQSLGHVHLVVKNPAYKALADLDGKKVVGAHLQSPKYVEKVMFDNAPAAKKIKLEGVATNLKGVKQVDRGEADAALLSDEEMQWLATSSFKDLHEIWKSEALPPMSVSVTKLAKPADKEAISKMLLSMCSDPKGAEVCKALDVDKFTPPDTAAYEAAAKKMAKQ